MGKSDEWCAYFDPGSDTRGEDAGRADTIMVLQLDGPSHKPKLISFMRDSFVTIPG